MKTTYFAMFCIVSAIMFPGNAHCNNGSAESHVKEFYQLYASCETNLSIDSDLSGFVAFPFIMQEIMGIISLVTAKPRKGGGYHFGTIRNSLGQGMSSF